MNGNCDFAFTRKWKDSCAYPNEFSEIMLRICFRKLSGHARDKIACVSWLIDSRLILFAQSGVHRQASITLDRTLLGANTN